jgi:hypothetical protein
MRRIGGPLAAVVAVSAAFNFWPSANMSSCFVIHAAPMSAKPLMID